jgi:adenosylhomocysteine nucleosidase
VIVLAVTGLAREASIIARDGVKVVVSGSNPHQLEQMFEQGIDAGVCGIISTGIAGALDPGLEPGACVLASRVSDGEREFATDESWTDAIFEKAAGAVRGLLAGSNSLLSSAHGKKQLREHTGALAVDMESHIAARVAAAHDIPFTALRVISEGAGTVLPPVAQVAIGPDGHIAWRAVTRSLFAHPTQIPQLMRTARESAIAFRALLRCLDLLGTGFACPYLG